MHVNLTPDGEYLQQILEVNVLLVSHVLKTILAMDFGSSFMEGTTHGVIDNVPRDTRCLTLVGLLLLHPRNEHDLSHNNSPKDAPDSQYAFESVDLEDITLVKNTDTIQ